MSEAYTHIELSRVEERQRVDDSCTRCVDVHESFASKNTCVTAHIKQRIGLRFVLNIANTDQLKNALTGPDRLGWDIPTCNTSMVQLGRTDPFNVCTKGCDMACYLNDFSKKGMDKRTIILFLS